MRKGFRAIWGGVFFAFLWRGWGGRFEKRPYYCGAGSLLWGVIAFLWCGWGGRFEKRPYLWVRPYFVVRLVI